MRRFLATICVVGIMVLGTQACVLGFQQVTGSGRITSLDLSQQGFSKVHLGSGCRSQLRQASDYSVVVRIDDNLADDLDIERTGSELSISLKGHRSYRRITFEVDIAMPDLESLHLSGGSRCALTGFHFGHDIDFDLSGGSELRGDSTFADVDFSLSGGSSVEMMGKAGDVRLDGSGGSRFDLADFSGHDFDVDLSGGSTATIRIDGELSGSLSGGSQVRYIGDPTLGRIAKSGGAGVGPK